MALPPVVVGLLLYLLLSRSGPLGDLGWLFFPHAVVVAQIVLDLPFVIGITTHRLSRTTLPNGDAPLEGVTSCGDGSPGSGPAVRISAVLMLNTGYEFVERNLPANG